MSEGFGSPLILFGLAATPAAPPTTAGFLSPLFLFTSSTPVAPPVPAGFLSPLFLFTSSTPAVTPPTTPGEEYVITFRRRHGE